MTDRVFGVAAVALYALLATGAVLDIVGRRIPNWLTVAGTVVGVGCAVFGLGTVGWVASLLGAALGLVVGLLAFSAGILGGGDGKLLMALGAFLGPRDLFWAMLVIAMIGGLLALASAALGGQLFLSGWRAARGLKFLATFGQAGEMPPRDGAALRTVPYGVAIALGGVLWWVWGDRI